MEIVTLLSKVQNYIYVSIDNITNKIHSYVLNIDGD